MRYLCNLDVYWLVVDRKCLVFTRDHHVCVLPFANSSIAWWSLGLAGAPLWPAAGQPHCWGISRGNTDSTCNSEPTGLEVSSTVAGYWVPAHIIFLYSISFFSFSHGSDAGWQDGLGSFLGPSLPPRNCTEEEHWGSSLSAVCLKRHFFSWLHDETMRDIMVCAWKIAMRQKDSLRKRLGRQGKPNVSRRKMRNSGIWLIPEATTLMLLLDASSYKNSNYAP